MDELGAAVAVFPNGRVVGEPGADRDAELAEPVGCGGIAVDIGRVGECKHGTVTGIRGRHAAEGLAQERIRDAEFADRPGCGAVFRDAFCSNKRIRGEQGGDGGQPNTAGGEIGVLYRSGCVLCGSVGDDFDDKGVSTG